MARADHKVRLYIPDTLQQLELQQPFSFEQQEAAAYDKLQAIPPLHNGARILNGQYRITRLLYQRPRLNLYLGQHCRGQILPCRSPELARTTVRWRSEYRVDRARVAIRELILDGLPAQVCTQIEAAAFEEFVSPNAIGSPRLSSSADRIFTESGRHYLVIQLDDSAKARKTEAIPLNELLLSTRTWPIWLNNEVALQWGSQICRMVARLHRLGAKPGDLSPKTILVDRAGVAAWPPVLLPSWPPAPQFWGPSFGDLPTPLLHCRVFPIAERCVDDVFVAPEALYGMSDARSDVYVLGAILYLLITHYAPVSAARRLRVNYPVPGLDELDALELVAPCLLNTSISPDIEQLLLRTLALAPDERYQTVFELVEALENIII